MLNSSACKVYCDVVCLLTIITLTQLLLLLLLVTLLFCRWYLAMLQVDLNEELLFHYTTMKQLVLAISHGVMPALLVLLVVHRLQWVL
jgi:hypothetical protein